MMLAKYPIKTSKNRFVYTSNFEVKIKNERFVGRVFATAVVSLNIPECGVFADFVTRPKNNMCFHG